MTAKRQNQKLLFTEQEVIDALYTCYKTRFGPAGCTVTTTGGTVTKVGKGLVFEIRFEVS